MSDTNTRIEERETTNNFLITGIVIAFILLILGIILYLYISSLANQSIQDTLNTNNTTQQEQKNNQNPDDSDDDVIEEGEEEPLSYLI